MNTGQLEQYLADYDGKAVSLLSEARAVCQTAPEYLEELVSLCVDPRPFVSDGATWLLKAELEDGLALPSNVLLFHDG